MGHQTARGPGSRQVGLGLASLRGASHGLCRIDMWPPLDTDISLPSYAVIPRVAVGTSATSSRQRTVCGPHYCSSA